MNIKRKGAFDYDLNWWQNHSALVVPKAAEAFVLFNQVQNVSRYYVSNGGHKLVKVMPPIPKNGYLYRLDKDEQAVHTKVEIAKLERLGYERIGEVVIKKERHIGIHTEYTVKVCNDITQYDGDINYSYYIEETKKMVRGML